MQKGWLRPWCNALFWNLRENIEGRYYVAISDLRMGTRRSFSIEVRPMLLYASTGKLSALLYRYHFLCKL